MGHLFFHFFHPFCSFLPAAKPSGPRTEGVVVLVVGGSSLSEHGIFVYLLYNMLASKIHFRMVNPHLNQFPSV